VIDAPPTGLGIAEHVATQMHASAVRRLGGTERLERAVAHGDRGDGSLLHGSLLGSSLLDRLGRSTALEHGTQFEVLCLDGTQELDLRAELVSTLGQRAERRLLLRVHRGGVALGRSLAHRLHLGNDSGEFVEQCLDLVHGVTPGRDAAALKPPNHTLHGQAAILSVTLRSSYLLRYYNPASDELDRHDALVVVPASRAPQIACLILAAALAGVDVEPRGVAPRTRVA